MDISNLLPQLGISSIFAYVAWKLYGDMRADSLRREEQIRNDSKEREDKLMQHLDRQTDINERVAETLDRIDDRLCTLEEHRKNISKE
jgi:predicted nuclease with TOPRIM domain